MNQQEVDLVAKLRNEVKLEYGAIAERMGLSIDAVKRRYYEWKRQHPSDQKKSKKLLAPKELPFAAPMIAWPKEEVAPREPKICFFDIENAPIEGNTWGVYQQNVVRVIRDSYLMSFAYKFSTDKKITVRALPDYTEYENDKFNDKLLVEDLWHVFDEADILIAHNGDRFDIRKANARFLFHGLTPPSPYKTVDTLKAARRYFHFTTNRLNDLGQYLQTGSKLVHTGFDLWERCMNGDAKAWKTMKDYNVQDVRLLESVYEKLRPYIGNHPNINHWRGKYGTCDACGSDHIIRRGFYVAGKTKYQSLQCKDCGKYSRGDSVVLARM